MLTRHSITIDNSQVYYWERNPHAPNTIIFIHGFKGNHKGLTDLSEYFNNHRTILLDLPGYGQSGQLPVKHSIKNYAEFLYKFTQQLQLSSFDLVGHSYGGSIAIVYAGLHSETIGHLILISPAIPYQSLSSRLAKLQLTITQHLPQTWQKSWLTSPILEVISALTMIKTVSQKRKRELISAGLRTAKEQRPKVITEGLTSFLNTPFDSYAAKITTPTFILAGETDIIAPLKTQVHLAEKINLSRIDLMPDVGHIAPLERPITVGRLIERYLTHDTKQPSHVHITNDQCIIQPKHHKTITPTIS